MKYLKNRGYSVLFRLVSLQVYSRIFPTISFVMIHEGKEAWYMHKTGLIKPLYRDKHFSKPICHYMAGRRRHIINFLRLYLLIVPIVSTMISLGVRCPRNRSSVPGDSKGFFSFPQLSDPLCPHYPIQCSSIDFPWIRTARA